jgi:hypothetical protein
MLVLSRAMGQPWGLCLLVYLGGAVLWAEGCEDRAACTLDSPCDKFEKCINEVQTPMLSGCSDPNLEVAATTTAQDAVSSPSGIFGMLRKLSLTMQVGMLLSGGTTGSARPQNLPVGSKAPAVINYTTSEAGNPFVDGWYADPDTAIYDDLYWVYPTSSYAYEQQTYLNAFSSPDLINWTKHPNILTIADVKWAKKAVWAPAPAERNGKYYIYFGANDIQEGEPEKGLIGGIGVAVAEKPEGPYIDAIGKPLIGEYHNGAQPIDQDVFIDDDGQAYIYYGGHGYANVAKLNDDLISLGTLDDNGTVFKNITPQNYVEGAQMMKRNGIYYFMWSEGGWTGPDYSVSYAMADSPLGPFPRKAKILQQDSAVAKGSGHNGVIHVPGTDIYYIVYHRRPLSETDGNHRVLAYDRLYFNEDGTIAPVRMLVKDNFTDGNMIGWKAYGGNWSVVDERLQVEETSIGMAFLDTNFTDLIFDATINLSGKSNSSGSAGLVFRASGNDTSGFKGYYVGLSSSAIFLESFSIDAHVGIANTSLPRAQRSGRKDAEYEVRVSAVGQAIQVFVDDMDVPKLTVSDATFSTGKTGVMVVDSAASFGDVSILKPDEFP